MGRVPTQTRPRQLAADDKAAKQVLAAAPALVKITAETAFSWALWEGANRATMKTEKLSEQTRQIASGYRNSCTLALVVRLSLLLDSDQRVISFQSVYRYLERPEVTTALIRRVCADDPMSHVFQGRKDRTVRASVDRYLRKYRAIDWKDLHGRLVHFRNVAIAHLTPQQVKRHVQYRELRSLVRSVIALSECLEPLLTQSDLVPVREKQIKETSDQAADVWITTAR
ncbi:MAG: hypothetical protein JO230_04830 [Xanthobacteraceae bacterium]|nr:hypothetical protein [Xanthobacteraceae bacterium]